MQAEDPLSRYLTGPGKKPFFGSGIGAGILHGTILPDFTRSPMVPAMAIARYPNTVIDCPDAVALATFYGALLDWKVSLHQDDANWAEIADVTGQRFSFQQVENYSPPVWPDQEIPQQMHIDVDVDDLDAAESAVLQLGATKHPHQPGTSFRVFLDPAGHPFCLCQG